MATKKATKKESSGWKGGSFRAAVGMFVKRQVKKARKKAIKSAKKQARKIIGL